MEKNYKELQDNLMENFEKVKRLEEDFEERLMKKHKRADSEIYKKERFCLNYLYQYKINMLAILDSNKIDDVINNQNLAKENMVKYSKCFITVLSTNVIL